MHKIIYLIFLGIASIAFGQKLEAHADTLVQYETVDGKEWFLINEQPEFFTKFNFDFDQKKATESSKDRKRNYEITEFQKLKDGNYVVGLKETGEEDLAVMIDFKNSTITILPRTNDLEKIKTEYFITEFKNK